MSTLPIVGSSQAANSDGTEHDEDMHEAAGADAVDNVARDRSGIHRGDQYGEKA